MPAYLKICLITAYACAAAILAVPFAARWFFPIADVKPPETLVGLVSLMVDTVSMAGRGALSMTLFAALFGGTVLLSFVAWLGMRLTRKSATRPFACGLPVVVSLVTLIAAIVLDDVLPELRR